jgi:pimeloyl-ACP methyl ester carboxylesterase
MSGGLASPSHASRQEPLASQPHPRPTAPFSGISVIEGSAHLWRRYDEAAARLSARFAGLYQWRRCDHVQPLALQDAVPARLRRTYATPMAWTEWGPRDAPLLVCLGGVANTAMRFSFLAADLAPRFRVACLDWLGRGHSGWLADEREYGLPTYVEQLRQWLLHLGVGDHRPVALLGSSMGGSVALALIARHPGWVSRLVLNDIGPFLARARRTRRAQTLARFHVFRSPDDIVRRIGAAQKNDGPVSDDIRLFLAHHQTRWSEENAGRIYRHDPRALMAYRREAGRSLDQWAEWEHVRCPVLLLHGMESDALSARTIARMRPGHDLSVAHIPRTGHTPMLSDRHQTHAIGAWLAGEGPDATEFSLPLAPERLRWA